MKHIGYITKQDCISVKDRRRCVCSYVYMTLTLTSWP